MMTGPLSPYCPLYRGFTVISNTGQTSGYNGKRVMILGFIVCILINSHIPSASYVARKREQVCGGTAPSEQDGLDQDVVHNHVQVHAPAHSSERNWASKSSRTVDSDAGIRTKLV
ncbi:uncharacterized protein LOC143022931 isoform X2 [Oratosquilla oratoria]|uniref:uncharacterized protein LOC143022931 isoform X2 n=1 Tax=Oratosquilla oratoria TaxID=337810 RepID=UPI003F76F4E4